MNPAPQQVHEYASTPVDAQARTYDAAGNYTGNGDVTVAYNANNQMIAFTDASGTTTYEYDALGRRIRKSTGGVTTEYLHSGHRVVEENPGDGRRIICALR